MNLLNFKNDTTAFRNVKRTAKRFQFKHIKLCGIDVTEDKTSIVIKEWQTMDEASIDPSPMGGYLFYMLSVAMKHCYETTKYEGPPLVTSRREICDRLQAVVQINHLETSLLPGTLQPPLSVFLLSSPSQP